MDKVRRVIEIASQLGSIQEFCEFVNTIHTVAKCTDSHCPVSYNDRRNFFLKVCMQNINLFWSMFKRKVKRT